MLSVKIEFSKWICYRLLADIFGQIFPSISRRNKIYRGLIHFQGVY